MQYKPTATSFVIVVKPVTLDSAFFMSHKKGINVCIDSHFIELRSSVVVSCWRLIEMRRCSTCNGCWNKKQGLTCDACRFCCCSLIEEVLYFDIIVQLLPRLCEAWRTWQVKLTKKKRLNLFL